MPNKENAHAANTIIAFLAEKSEGNASALATLQRNIINNVGYAHFIDWTTDGKNDASDLEGFDTQEQRIAFLKENTADIEWFVRQTSEHDADYLTSAITTKPFGGLTAADTVLMAVKPQQDDVKLMDSVMLDLLIRTKRDLAVWFHK